MDLKALARHLNLSMTTVSRALNGYDDVNARTRERVLAEAKRLGYTPNAIARKLSSGRAGAIGVVLPLPAGHFADPFFLELLIGIGEALRRAKLDLIVTSAPPGDEEIDAYRHLVEGRRVDGLIIARIRPTDERLVYLQERDFPFISHGRTEGPADYPFLEVDGRAGFRLATERLLAKGHRRIALISVTPSYSFARDRRQGYGDALAIAGLALDERLIRTVEMHEQGGERAALDLLQSDQPPSAILCTTDVLALGALKGIKEKGLKAGRDIAVIGHDDLPFAAYAEPPLTTMRQPIRKVGDRLASMMLRRLEGAEPAELQEIWTPELVARASDDGDLDDRDLKNRNREKA